MQDDHFLLIKTSKELLNWRQSIPSNDPNAKVDTVGIVPTMGNLHQGHLALAKASFIENRFTIVTIFVNPKQFGPSEDWDRYPRTLTKDCELLFEAWQDFQKSQKLSNHSLIIFAPVAPQEIYPTGFNTQIIVNEISKLWEGEHRPGHFAGVTTVVYLLFQLCKPHNAYFGLKDFQQFQVIHKMNHDLLLGINIIGHPIVRDADTLALSSRNQYLSEEGRTQAVHLPKTLQKLKNLCLTSRSFDLLTLEIQRLKSQDPKWEYLAYCDYETLLPLKKLQKKAILLAVYLVENTRLLDNQIIELTELTHDR